MTEPKQSHGKSIKGSNWILWVLCVWLVASSGNWERYEKIDDSNDVMLVKYRYWGLVVDKEHLKVQPVAGFGTGAVDIFSWDEKRHKWHHTGDGSWPQPPYDNKDLNRGEDSILINFLFLPLLLYLIAINTKRINSGFGVRDLVTLSIVFLLFGLGFLAAVYLDFSSLGILLLFGLPIGGIVFASLFEKWLKDRDVKADDPADE